METRFKLKDFEGPLDLLLFLVKKNEVNLYDIPIALITEQYLAVLKEGEADLEDLTDFYALAATLLYIKSRMLLPVESDWEDEVQDPREELIHKLIEYQKYKKLAALMVGQSQQGTWIIERKKIERVLPFEEDNLWEKVEVWDLLKNFVHLVGGLNSERLLTLYEEVTVNEKITLAYELLETKKSFRFEDLITQPQNLLDIICAFLAVLEMVKTHIIGVYQNKLFGDIEIRRADNPEAA